MDALDYPRRLLLVHAHPDDETIGTGATMAHYAADNTLVTLVTCTAGELGEVVVPELAHLAAEADDQLGEHRADELAAACEALGVRDHRFLGGAGRWRDSGMMGTPANDDPRCLWQADLDEATTELVRVVRDVRPQVIVTYDENGGYGHPDHIRANQLTTRAFDAASDPGYAREGGEPWRAQKLYHMALPKSALQAVIDHFRDKGAAGEAFGGATSADDVPMGVPDHTITTVIDASDQVSAKVAALRAHRSQVSVNGMFFELAEGLGNRSWGVEHYVLARGELGEPGPGGREDDLFAGTGA
jgi:N-acetyl-1-D-myo-inositol-2-amino-2-deoxy-alpha-D-glucopyranoside deacetylase